MFIFFVNNGKNVERRKQGKQSQFWDDRGAWVGGNHLQNILCKREWKSQVYNIPAREIL